MADSGDFVSMSLSLNSFPLQEKRKMDHQFGVDLAKEFNIPFFETSSVKNVNIEESVHAVVGEIYKVKEGENPIAPTKGKECLLM
jgi:hypothetical protein